MATCDRCTRLEQERDEAYGYLARLFAFCAPQCKPLPSLPGLATQIDNYIAGLHKKQQTAERALAQTREALEELAERTAPDGDMADQAVHGVVTLILSALLPAQTGDSDR